MNWFGEIPAHWDCKKIGALFTERKTKASDKEYPPLSVTKTGVLPQLETAVKTDAGDNRKLVRAGDFVINSRSDRKGSCGVSKLDGSVSLVNIVLTPRDEWNAGYVHYLMRSQAFSEEYYRNGRGIVGDLWTTRYSEMKSILLPVPPRDEQDRIVRFLDWKVSLVNRLINLRRGEIKALDSLKRSMVNQAVTRGLSPDAPMKDSGAQWLGDIPAHWETQKIKYTFSERSEKGYPDEPLLVASQNMGVVPKNVYGNRTVEALKDLRLLKLVKRGDFVISLRSFQGGIELAHYQGIISPAYTVMIPDRRITEGYFRYLAKSHAFIQLLKLCVTGIREGQTIDYGKLKNHKIPLPPRDEQDRIVRFLDERTARLDSLTDTLTAEISALAECRSKLISDVVTGKMDVRDAANEFADGGGAED